jgi:Transposase
MNLPPPAEKLLLLDAELWQLDARRGVLLARRTWLISTLYAAVVVDCFRIAQLAQRHLADLRRRLTWKQHGRRARKGDGIYTVHKLLRRNKEDLTEDQRTLLKAELHYMGTYGRQIYAA